MSILPSESENVVVHDAIDEGGSTSRRLDNCVPVVFAVLAGVAMLGWIYLIGKGVWMLVLWMFR